MSKNVAVFVDVANIFYAAKAAGVDIDYVTLLKSATAGRDLVRAYAYTGLDPENENQRNFHSFLARHGYKVVSKDIRKYGDGKVKANLDIELVIDMMKTARNLDIAIVVSGDGDFAPAIRAVQEMGVRVEVISFRGNTSSDLIDVADLFTDIVQLARVEKASSRSGRRVAGDDEDLSMTEVPDKQTEGSGAGRGRGRGRRSAGGRDAEPAASRGGRRSAEPVAVVTSSGAPLVVLPGEKLSKVSPAAVAELGEGVEDDEATAAADAGYAAVGATERAEDGDTGGRRRRRRGGRGRGRGRQRGEGGEQRLPAEPAIPGELGVAEEEEFVAAPPRAPRSTPFGSVWDSQLGVPTSVPSTAPPVGGDDEEDFEEPEIPEYLIAERRNRGRGPASNRGRGNRSAYAAAMDRERYGGGRGGGINRYPDVGDRGRAPQGPATFQRRDRPERPDRDRPQRPDRDRFERQPRSGDEPWSEVPPELEAMLRAQVASRPRSEPAPRDVSDGRGGARTEVTIDAVAVPIEVAMPAEPVADNVPEAVVEPVAAAEAPKRRTTRRTTKASEAVDASKVDAPKRRTTARKTATTKAAPDDTEKPKRRTTRRKATESQADEAATAADAGAE